MCSDYPCQLDELIGLDERKAMMTFLDIVAELDAIADHIESVWEHGKDRQLALEEVESRVIGLARRIRAAVPHPETKGPGHP